MLALVVAELIFYCWQSDLVHIDELSCCCCLATA